MMTLEELASDALAQELARAFAESGQELYLVGGAVRDQLLAQLRPHGDLDFATSAPPPLTGQIIREVFQREPYTVGEKFGTIALRLAERVIEITTYRSERYQPGSRRPEVQFGTSLQEDLQRRDFTINAMARNPLTGELIDPTGGERDLTAGLIRAVGNAVERFGEDPLRLLRAVRFATRLDFAIEPGTWDAMQARAATLSSISRERIRDEYTKFLEGERPSRALCLLRDSGLLAASVPQLLELDRMPDHGPRHPLSLWDHTMRVVDAVPPLLAVRWAALLHDIAKPRTRIYEPSGRPRFFHHEDVGADMARHILTGLRYSNQLVDGVTLLVESHMQMHAYSPSWSDGAVRRLLLRLGPLTESALALARADAAGHTLNGISANAPRYDQLAERIRTLESEPVARLTSPLNGAELMARYGRPPGPWIRRIKDALQDEVIEGRLAPGDRERAWEVADRLVSSQA